MRHAPEQYQPKLQDQRQWRRAVEAKKDTPHAGAMLLQALTFDRINEACRVEWSEIDMEAGTWTLPPDKTKIRKTHVVHLSDAALALRESRRDNKNKFVFPAINDPSRHLDPELVGHWWQSRREAGGFPAGMTSHAPRRAVLGARERRQSRHSQRAVQSQTGHGG
jgi:integrase